MIPVTQGKCVYIMTRTAGCMQNIQRFTDVVVLLCITQKGEPLSIHVFMNTLLKFEGTVYQAKCIQWGEKDYELLVNADRSRLDETELLAAYRHYLGEDAELRITYVDQIPIQASGKFMVCENKWNGRKQA